MPKVDAAENKSCGRGTSPLVAGFLLTWMKIRTHHRSRTNFSVKVLDFIKSGGPELTVDRTIFEMWLGGL